MPHRYNLLKSDIEICNEWIIVLDLLFKFFLSFGLNFVNISTRSYYLRCSEHWLRFTALQKMPRQHFLNCLLKGTPQGKRPHLCFSNFEVRMQSSCKAILVTMENFFWAFKVSELCQIYICFWLKLTGTEHFWCINISATELEILNLFSNAVQQSVYLTKRASS
jgi:hypothetical protein